MGCREHASTAGIGELIVSRGERSGGIASGLPMGFVFETFAVENHFQVVQAEGDVVRFDENGFHVAGGDSHPMLEIGYEQSVLVKPSDFGPRRICQLISAMECMDRFSVGGSLWILEFPFRKEFCASKASDFEQYPWHEGQGTDGPESHGRSWELFEKGSPDPKYQNDEKYMGAWTPVDRTVTIH